MVREHQELQLCDQQCVAARTEVEALLWSQTPTWTFRKELGVGLSQGKLQGEANSHWTQSGKELKPFICGLNNQLTLIPALGTESGIKAQLQTWCLLTLAKRSGPVLTAALGLERSYGVWWADCPTHCCQRLQ